ncbi:hypothetical protein BIV57_21610 [Mangrovactinospora gilvigrisea]|uniref:Sulfatase N-terminal domain-containing protein n=1 Tax=Mangrovactinospora gilvigrisea TaxID=1428644 RepID=A0A1J7C1H9_9ACTN|nr:sulfatase-like hydrolase/transferase [Mangrovactinospora gilvigrisea]OIV35428.1 hypothetical protein BIV57_21610 [Mangrovactinospora gilvigrisea]
MSEQPRRRPNILFLIADDHRGFHDPQVATPHLDALAGRGTRFLGARCQGGMNGAICAPSRAQIMTGNELFGATRNNVVGDWPGTSEIAEDAPILPEALAAAGYRTHLVGKWHNGAASAARGFATGEAVFLGGMSDHWAVPARTLDAGRAEPFSEPEIREQHSTDLFAEAGERFLRGYDAEDPFFLYMAFTAPHDPRTAPPEWAARYNPDDIELPPSFMAEHPFDNGGMHERDEHITPFPHGAGTVRRHLADYYAMIGHLDDGIGRVLRALEESGHAEDTVVVYTADHGLALGAHGLLGKQNSYEHSLRVPLVMAGPGVPAGREVDALSLHADLFPTLAELAGGLPVPGTVTGRSLAPLLDGRSEEARGYVHSAYIDVQRSVRDERWKLIRYRRTEARGGAGTDLVQLFDLAADPWETRDLSADPAHAAERDRLAAELARWQHAIGDPHAEDFAEAAFTGTD